MLQCVTGALLTVCCNVLQYVTECCSVLQRVAACCTGALLSMCRSFCEIRTVRPHRVAAVLQLCDSACVAASVTSTVLCPHCVAVCCNVLQCVAADWLSVCCSFRNIHGATPLHLFANLSLSYLVETFKSQRTPKCIRMYIKSLHI